MSEAVSAEHGYQTKVNSITEYDRLNSVEESTKTFMNIISQCVRRGPFGTGK